MNKINCQDCVDGGKIDKVIAKYQDKPGAALGILEEVQELNPHKYLPSQTLQYIAKKINISLAKIYSIVTFYSFFNLKPQGRHSIVVCRGTACHTKGSKPILYDLINTLDFAERNVPEGEKIFLTSRDKMFTVKTVACFGQCAMAPVVEIDGEIYSNMTTQKLKDIIEKIKKGKK